MFVSYRGRVTKFTPECFRKASVAEQMRWDITTKENALFEMALDKENLSCTTARPLNLDEEVNSTMNDDGGMCEHVAQHIILTRIASHFYGHMHCRRFEFEMCSKSARITLQFPRPSNMTVLPVTIAQPSEYHSSL